MENESRKGEFSVCQFFKDTGGYEYVVRFVDKETAVRKFIFYTNNVSSKIGTTERVIITDGGDTICMEWKFNEGIIFPPELKGKMLRFKGEKT